MVLVGVKDEGRVPKEEGASRERETRPTALISGRGPWTFIICFPWRTRSVSLKSWTYRVISLLERAPRSRLETTKECHG